MAADDFTIDFTDYKDTQGDYVPPGPYVCIIEDAETGTSTQKGTPQLTLWLRVVGGEYDGLTLVENLYLTKPSRFRFASFLKALNLKVPKGKAPFKARSFLNRRVVVIAEDNEYKNKIRTRVGDWQRYVAPGAGGVSETDETGEDLSGLDEFGAGTDESAVDLPDEEATFEDAGDGDFSFDAGEEDDALATGPGDEIPAPTTEEEVTAEAAPKAAAPAAAPKAAPAAAAPKTEAPSAPAEAVAEPDSLEDEVAAALESDFEDSDDTGPDGAAEVAVVGSDDSGDEESMELADLEDLEV